MFVSVTDYNSRGYEPCTDENELLRAIKRAENLVDVVTGGVVAGAEELSEEKKEPLRIAICQQAEQYIMFGYATDEEQYRVQIGDFSYSGGGVRSVCPITLAVLRLNGLVCVAADVRG